MNQLVLKDTAAALRVPFPAETVPASYTVSVYDSDGDALTGWDAAAGTVVSYATTASAAEGDKSIAVNWNSQRQLQAGEPAFLALAASPNLSVRESVTVDRVSGTTVYLTEQLENAWASGSKLYPAFFIADVGASLLDTASRNLRIKIVVTYSDLSGGEATGTFDRLFDVVVHVPTNPVSSQVLEVEDHALWMILYGQYRGEKEGVERRINAAWEGVLDSVWPRLKPDRVLSDDQFRRSVVAYLRLRTAVSGRVPHGSIDVADYQDIARTEWDAARQDLLACIAALDVDEDEVVDSDETNRSAIRRIIRRL